MSMGKVYMIGAGCGSYDLITIRGMEALKKCDVVLFDSLTDTHLLDFLPESCERIYVGKRAGMHSTPQETINKMLLQKAEQGKIVARLKGGDPFVFGRGGEELLFLIKNNIPFEIIPGISSAVAVPEMAGIPVTHREVSRSFHVITGHTKEDMLPEQFRLYAKLSGTLVFLMGLAHIEQIARNLIEYGKSPDTPAAVISNGGKGSQHIVRGRLAEISGIAKTNKICSPAVIVVGDTAAFELCSPEKKILDGISVTITGTKYFAYKLSEKLIEYGAYVNCENLSDIVSYENEERIYETFADIFSYTMIVLTSRNGAEIFFRILRKMHIDIRKLSCLRFAVIGKETAKILEDHGIYADIVPKKFSSEFLAEAIIKNKKLNENLLLLRAEKSSPVLTDILLQNKISFKEVKIYDVKSERNGQPHKINTDFIVFGSRSEVTDFYSQGHTFSTDTTAVCMGKTTASEVKTKFGINTVIPEIQNAEGIVSLIKKLKGR